MNTKKVSYILDYISILLCKSLDPTISVAVLQHSGQNELHYYCDIYPEPDTDYNYTIQWYLSVETSFKKEIETFEPLKFDEEFRNLTALTESQLKYNGIEAFPYTVC